MNRRSFLTGLLGTAGAAFALDADKILNAAPVDPDELLWTPGKKTIFLPPAQGFIRPVELIETRIVRSHIEIDLPAGVFLREGLPPGFSVADIYWQDGYVTLRHENTPEEVIRAAKRRDGWVEGYYVRG